MVMRIDYQNFLTKMIDFFNMDEILSIYYVILSAKVANGGTTTNVSKCSILYPSVKVIEAYASTGDYKLFEEMYSKELKSDESEVVDNYIYKIFIKPIQNHANVCIVCDRSENDYAKAFSSYLEEEFAIEVLDLNQLFNTGKVGPLRIDLDEVHDRGVPVSRRAAKREIKTMASTEDGRIKLISMMRKKEKLKRLKQYGIKVTDDDKDLDSLLQEAWAAEVEGELLSEGD